MEQTVFEFAGFTLDGKRRRLLDDEGKPIILTARAFDTLLFLLQHHGETLSKKQLMEAVWPNQIVEDNNLTQAISTVRKALGDKQNAQRIIVTIPGRGYSCVAEVQSPTPVNVKEERYVEGAMDNGTVKISEAVEASPAKPLSFFSELKRRNVFRVGAAYGIVLWLVIQIIVSIEGPLNLPDWFDTVVIVLLAIGLPIALLLAWAFELTPEGIKLTEEVARSKSITRTTGQKLNRWVFSGLALALVIFVFDSYFLDDATELDTQSGDQSLVETASDESTETATGDIPEKSIAVLPFTNLSSDEEQEYFVDGLTEDLLTKLAGIKDLQVTGRTSSFYFKDRQFDLREIGQTLGVAHLLEGSVRRSDDPLRITAQLIEAETDYQLWADTCRAIGEADFECF